MQLNTKNAALYLTKNAAFAVTVNKALIEDLDLEFWGVERIEEGEEKPTESTDS